MASSSADVASEHIAEDGELYPDCIMMQLISFNFGIHQDMLKAGPWRRRHSQKFGELMDTFSEDYNADVVLGCEVGGHKEGMTKENQKSLKTTNLNVTCTQNYITALNQRGITTQLLREPLVTALAGTTALDTQLVLTAVQAIQGTKKAAITIIGNMHIRTPSGKNVPTIATKQRLVREALRKLVDYGDMVEQAVPASERPGSVLLLVGDCNLNEVLARQAVASLQPGRVKGEKASDIWRVKPTRNGLSGDLCFLRGCVASTFDVQVGASFCERGMRNDSHDALGLILRLPVFSDDSAEECSPTSPANVPELSAEDVASNALHWWKPQQTNTHMPSPAPDFSSCIQTRQRSC